MKSLKEIVGIAFFSALVGSIVALPVALLLNGTPLVDSLKGAGVGALIGLAAHFSFTFFYRHLSENRNFGLLLIAAVIGLGTSAGAYVLGVRQASHFVLLIALAEATGLTMAALGYRRYMRLNEKLKSIQEKLS
jgi:hypothetical protein